VSAGVPSFKAITRIDRSAFSLPTGIRAGCFISAPLLVGLVTGQKDFLYTTLGALLLTNTEGPRTISAPLRILLVACFTEGVAFGVGTLAGTTGFLAVPLVGIGVFVALLAALRPTWAPVGTWTAVTFAVGVGLPGGSVSISGVRLVFSLLGALWGLTGVGLHRLISTRIRHGNPQGVRSSTGPTATQPGILRPGAHLVRSEAFKHAVIVGVASTIGHGIGISLGLPRDYWIVATIILALRPSIGETLSFTTMIVGGTLIGAVIAATVTLGVSEDYALWVLMLCIAVALYATRGVNFGLTQVFFTPFVVVLLNILYPGQWQLAETRILDVAIGGAISVVSVYLLSVRRPGAGNAQGNVAEPSAVH
jgi:hypothetical protein